MIKPRLKSKEQAVLQPPYYESTMKFSCVQIIKKGPQPSLLKLKRLKLNNLLLLTPKLFASLKNGFVEVYNLD